MLFLGIIWNPSDTLFTIGPLQIKYYNLLWITAFALGWALMKKIFLSENKSMEKLDSLFIHTVIATMLGARLGHVFFYDWPYYKNHLLEILLPIREGANGFEFTGFTGLASHGAAIGIIIGMMLFIRKWPEFTLLGILDRVVIPVSIGAVCIRVGNFFNSEINGKPVEESFVFATKFIRDSDDMHPSKVLSITKQDNLNAAYRALETNPEYSEYIAAMPFRHPAQLYEAFCYIFVFLILWYLFWKTDKKEKAGFLFGTFLVLLWTIRFFVEYVKKSQGGFEESLGLLSTGQWLSVPFIIIGLYFMLRPKKVA